MIKLVLKSLFPPVILKKGFLFVNWVKIHTVDKLFFPPLRTSNADFFILREVNPFLPLQIPVGKFPNEIQKGLRLWTNPAWVQDEYLFLYNDGGLIEPEVGWAFSLDRKLIYPSLGFSNAGYVTKPGILNSFFRRKKIVKRKTVLSLRDTGEENYFHFFNDVLSKIFFMIDEGFSLQNYTIVISEKLASKEYFKVFANCDRLRDLDWYVQRDEWIEFEKAAFCKPLTHTKKYFQNARLLLPTFPGLHGKRRIFLNRSRRSLRYIENIAELKPTLKKYHFEFVEAETLPFLSQAKLFSECSYLIGVHGAGLSNMIFRDGSPLSIVEIMHPFEYIPFHYIMLARQFDFEYTALLGEKMSNQGGFFVDRFKFENTVRQLLHE